MENGHQQNLLKLLTKSLRSPEQISPNFATKKLTADEQNAKHEC